MPPMTQREDLIEALASFPPPIPLRNPLRNILRYQTTPHYHSASNDNIEAFELSVATQIAFEEADCEPSDTEKSPPSDGYLFRRPDAKMDRRTCKIYYDARPLRDEDKVSLTSASSSLSNGLKRYSALLGKGNISTVQQDDERSRKQGEIEHAMARIRNSLDMSETLTSISSYDGASIAWPIVEAEEDDARIEAWLQRGVIDTPSSEFDRASQSEKAQDSRPVKRHPALTIFPLASSTTGRREYTSPLSPMNNGRDAYGNYIATNVRDYHTAQPSPRLSTSRSIGQITPRQKQKQKQKQKQSSRPHMRGGGGWWNTLGIGKDPLATEQPMAPEPRSIPRSTSVPSLKSIYSMGNQEHPSSNFGGYVEDSLAGGLSLRRTIATRDRALDDAEDDWSGGSGLGITETYEHRRLKHMKSNLGRQHGKMQDRHQYPSNISTPLSSGRPHTQNYNTYQQTITTSSDDRKSSCLGAAIRTMSELDSDPKRPFAARQRIESPQSDVMHSPRTHKRWNKGPATGPPTGPAMPPPIPPKDVMPMSEVASSLGEVSLFKAQYERPDSPVESYDDHAWELQSLQLGESVSVAGHGPRHQSGGGVTRHGPTDLSPEEFEAAQLRGQVEFLPLCQDIMIHYNAEISRIDRALQRDEMSSEQYQAQWKWNVDNKKKALTYSAEKSGYVILKDEFSILEALNTTDGFAIYQDMLKSTNSDLWQKLADQHHMAQTMHSPTNKPRGSSIDQARQVAGKIARLMLAAPSDPDLKTYSTRRPSDAQPNTSMPLAFMDWMDPMSAAASSGTTNNDAWRVQRKNNKPKEAEKHVVMRHEAIDTIDTIDFAPHSPVPSRLTGTAATANDRNAQWYTGHHTAPAPAPQVHAERPGPPIRRNSHATTTASDQSMWPEGDSLGNWQDVKRPVDPHLRGGAGKAEKVKAKKSKPWRSVMYGEAMHFHG